MIACTIGPFGESLASNSKEAIKCMPVNNKRCWLRPTLVDETLFYPFIVSVNKCGGSCYTIDDPYAGVCVPNKVKNVSSKNL